MSDSPQTRLRGVSHGHGMALGACVVVNEQGGVPLPPVPPDSVAAALASHRTSEVPEVVVAASTVQSLAMILPTVTWARVVGAAIETPASGIPNWPFPVVHSVDGLLSAARTARLLLLDTGTSAVMPDPDAFRLAMYTAEHARIAPRQRVYLDEGHDPAVTLDGREIRVIALVERVEDCPEAVEAGADGLYVDLAVMPGDPLPHTLLFDLIHAAPGKPILLANAQRLSSRILVEASVEAELQVSVPPSLDGEEGYQRFQKVLATAEMRSLDEDIPARMPGIVGWIGDLDPDMGEAEIGVLMDQIEEVGATRLVIAPTGAIAEGLLSQLDPILGAARSNTVPVYIAARAWDINPFGQGDLSNGLDTCLQLLVGAGASGVILPAVDIPEAKRIIRTVTTQECIDTYLSAVGGAGL